MSDALLSSLHEFWMQNSEYVTGDMLCAIFGPSCAQTKLISDPKGPVVYLNAEAGETAQQVFQYILERAVAFVNDARPVDAEGVSFFRLRRSVLATRMLRSAFLKLSVANTRTVFKHCRGFKGTSSNNCC